MAFSKSKVLAAINIDEDFNISVREDVVVYEDGVEISRRSHRTAFVPGDDVSRVVGNTLNKITNALWTPEVIAAAAARREAALAAASINVQKA